MSETAVTTRPATVAVQKASGGGGGFELTSINQAYRLAENLSNSGLIPTALRGKPDDILVVLMSGRELGILPMQSLRHLYVIEGRIHMSAQMVLARVLKSGQCEYFTLVESTDQKATFKTKRKGSLDEEKLTYTAEQARAMGLFDRKGDNWKKQPATMLRWRAVTSLSRIVYPDIIEGVYSDDEAEDFHEGARMMAESLPPRTLDQLKQKLQPAMEVTEAVDQVTGEVTEERTAEVAAHEAQGPPASDEPPSDPEPEKATVAGPTISQEDGVLLWAAAKEGCERHKLHPTKPLLIAGAKSVLKQFGYKSMSEVRVADFDQVIAAIKEHDWTKNGGSQ